MRGGLSAAGEPAGGAVWSAAAGGAVCAQDASADEVGDGEGKARRGRHALPSAG